MPDSVAPANWVVTLNPNPKDTRPITFAWSDGELVSSDEPMRAAVVRLAERVGELGATPTGPFVPANLSIPHVAFAMVYRLATMAGLTEQEIQVQGDGWQWPTLQTVADAGVVY